MSVRAITFDFWGTLFRDARSEERQRLRLEAVMRTAQASEDAAMTALQETFREFYRSHLEDQRTLRPEDGVRMTFERLRTPLNPDIAEELTHIFATAILTYPPEPIDWALDAVRAAAQRFPVGLISDTGISPGSSLRVLMDRHQFTEHFAALTFSDEVGVAKPQTPMFARTAEALGVAPAELLHIGDLEPTDIAGARNVGAKAALYAGVNDRYAGKTQADHTFTDWREFIALLPEIA